MERHPRYTLDILERVSAFRGFARTAALHHEKLDGSGYPFDYDGEELDLPGAHPRASSDIYDALSSDRPYREGDGAEPVITRSSSAIAARGSVPSRSTRCTPCAPIASRRASAEHEHGRICEDERRIVQSVVLPLHAVAVRHGN